MGEARYPRGSPSPDPSTTLSTDELIDKYRDNAQGVISANQIDASLRLLTQLESVDDFSELMSVLRVGQPKVATKPTAVAA